MVIDRINKIIKAVKTTVRKMIDDRYQNNKTLSKEYTNPITVCSTLKKKGRAFEILVKNIYIPDSKISHASFV